MTELEPIRNPAAVDSWVSMIGPVGDLAARIARTPFVPRAMQGNPAAVAAAILTGRELNLGPMTSLRGIDVIEGRPSLSAQLLAARILAAGHRIEWKESGNERCTVTIERGDGLSSATATFSMADAKRAGLDHKTNWTKYPRAMLRARALTEAATMACPDVALGLDTEAQPETVPTPNTEKTVAIQVDPGRTQPAETRQDGPQADESAVVDAELVPDAVEALGEPVTLITTMQQRFIRLVLREIATLTSERLSDEAQRQMIAEAAGVPDLQSSKHLTYEQAGQVIDNLRARRDELAQGSLIPEA